MFREGVVLVDRHGTGLLPHEQTRPQRVAALVQAWSQSGAVQKSPVTLLVDPRLPARLIVADGHHRLAAARVLAQRRGSPLALAARFLSLSEHRVTIMPAHRVVRTAPRGWIESCRRRLHCVGEQRSVFTTPPDLGAVEQLRFLDAVVDLGECEWSFEGDKRAVIEELESGRAQAVILYPALAIADVLHAAVTGQLLPSRSTNFQPKPPESSIHFPLAAVSQGVLRAPMLP